MPILYMDKKPIIEPTATHQSIIQYLDSLFLRSTGLPLPVPQILGILTPDTRDHGKKRVRVALVKRLDLDDGMRRVPIRSGLITLFLAG